MRFFLQKASGCREISHTVFRGSGGYTVLWDTLVFAVCGQFFSENSALLSANMGPVLPLFGHVLAPTSEVPWSPIAICS